MKKRICIAFVVFLIVGALTAGSFAETADKPSYECGDFTYELLDDGTARITKWNGTEGELVIPDVLDGYAVTCLGTGAVTGESEVLELASIHFPSQQITIESWAFQKCIIDELILSDNLIIESGAFYSCTVYNLTMPDTLENIDRGAFSACRIDMETFPDHYEVLDSYSFCGTSPVKIHFPANLKQIGDEALEHLSNLSIRFSFIIPDGVESVGNESLARNNWYSITIPQSMRTIGDQAFSYSKIIRLEIPDGVISIGDAAFGNNVLLEEVFLPETTEELGANPFRNCNQLKYIYVSPDNESLASIDGVLFSKADKKLVSYPIGKPKYDYEVDNTRPGGTYGLYNGEEEKAEAVEEREDGTVYGAGTQEDGKSKQSDTQDPSVYTAPEGTKIIGASSFENSKNLRVVLLPTTVEAIEENAFKGSTIKEMMFPNGLMRIGNSAFQSCSNLSHIDVPDSVKDIGEGAFAGCPIEEIAFPDSVQSMGDNPMENCRQLQRIEVSPDHAYLATIEGVLFSKPDKRLICYPMAKGEQEYTVPQGIKIIGRTAFYDCDVLTTIIFPNGLEEIQDDAFRDSDGLTAIDLPNTIGRIGERAFYDCDSLASITLQEGIKEIGNRAFGDCVALEEVEIPEGVESIGSYAFSGCKSLQAITLPESAETIGDDAFSGCSEELVITVVRDSYAMEYCKEHGLKYTYSEVNDWLNG